MLDWLVFWMGVATIRILIRNVTCMLHAEYAASAVCKLFDTYWHPNSGNQLIFINITRHSK
jgi:hypothetical protein